jgi:hypothetical protein
MENKNYRDSPFFEEYATLDKAPLFVEYANLVKKMGGCFQCQHPGSKGVCDCEFGKAHKLLYTGIRKLEAEEHLRLRTLVFGKPTSSCPDWLRMH